MGDGVPVAVAATLLTSCGAFTLEETWSSTLLVEGVETAWHLKVSLLAGAPVYSELLFTTILAAFAVGLNLTWVRVFGRG